MRKRSCVPRWKRFRTVCITANAWRTMTVFTTRRWVIKVKVTVEGSEVYVDFTGTCPQVTTAINCPFSSTVSATHTVLKMIMTDPSFPINDGSYRPVHIYAPKGACSTRRNSRR